MSMVTSRFTESETAENVVRVEPHRSDANIRLPAFETDETTTEDGLENVVRLALPDEALPE